MSVETDKTRARFDTPDARWRIDFMASVVVWAISSLDIKRAGMRPGLVCIPMAQPMHTCGNELEGYVQRAVSKYDRKFQIPTKN